MHLCECGCGQETPIAPRNDPRGKYKRGEHRRYIKGHQSRKSGPKYRVTDTGCWEWLWTKNAKGYGLYRDKSLPKSPMRGAHIVYYEQAHGRVPKGLQIDHVCRNPACVNPDHLEAVTPAENTRRGIRLRWGNRYGSGTRTTT